MQNTRHLTHSMLASALASAWILAVPRHALAAEDVPQTTAELPEITVTGQIEEGSAESGYRNETATTGPLGKTPLQDTPYSINVTSGEQIENRDAHTVSDALKTNPTVATLMDTGGYTSMSRVMVRGFTAADQSDLRDGLVDRSFAYVPLENVERIEVLNGLSGFLYGFSALGGSVNYVSKQPTSTPMVSIATGQYGGGINYLHGDAGGPIDHGGRWSYRFNAYDEDGSTYIGGSQNRNLLSGVMNFKLNRDTLIHADIWHQSLEMNGIQTYINPASGTAVPNASDFDATRQYGQGWTYNKAEKTLMGFGLESALSNSLTLRTAYRYGDMWRDYLFVKAALTGTNGNYTETASGSTRQFENTHSSYVLFDTHLNTGPIEHKMTFGHTDTSFVYTRGNDVTALLGTSNIDAPVVFANPNLVIGPTNAWSKSIYSNWVIGDRMKFTPRWSALVGFNRAELSYDNYTSNSSDYDQKKLTPSYALLYKPVPALTTYASYMEGLQTGGTAPSTAVNANEMLPPSVSKQYEIGAKGHWGGMDLTAALFRMDVINQYIDPADNVYKQDGREVHQGLEVTATGRLTDRLTMVGGFTVMSAEVKRARNNPSIEGKTPVNVPEQQARMYLEYDLTSVPGLTLSGGANYFGKRPTDSLDTYYLDGATTYDAGARYRTHWDGHDLTFNLNVSNLFNKAYWSYYRSGDGLLLGAPRVVSFMVKAEL